MPSRHDLTPMGFAPVRVSIESGLESPGDTISRQETIELASFEMGGRSFELADGLSYDVALTNTGDGILATGIVRGRATTACDRCLEPAELDIAGEVSCYFLHEEPEGEVADEEDFGLIDESDGTVDLSEAIQGAVAMDIPFVVLCQDDCRGLCPVCGANLNEVDCGCTVEPDPDFELAKNPFAALAGFTFADGTVLADHADELAGAGAPRPDEGDDLSDDDDDVSDDEFEAEWERLHGTDAEDEDL